MKKVLAVLLSVLMVVVFVSASFAADMSGSSSSSSGAYRSSTMTGSSQAFRASDLIGASVKNTQGEDLGKINDLAINQQGNAVFAVISHGGTLGVGSKMIPVPLSALQIDQSGKSARLDISKSKLDSAPTFTSTNWQDMMNRQWTEDTYRYYGVSPSWSSPSSSQSPSMQSPGTSSSPGTSMTPGMHDSTSQPRSKY